MAHDVTPDFWSDRRSRSRPVSSAAKRVFTLALFDQVCAALLPRRLHDKLHLTPAKKHAGPLRRRHSLGAHDMISLQGYNGAQFDRSKTVCRC
jgi:hypothetical protein